MLYTYMLLYINIQYYYNIIYNIIYNILIFHDDPIVITVASSGSPHRFTTKATKPRSRG